jgi:hypothetical protein
MTFKYDNEPGRVRPFFEGFSGLGSSLLAYFIAFFFPAIAVFLIVYPLSKAFEPTGEEAQRIAIYNQEKQSIRLQEEIVRYRRSLGDVVGTIELYKVEYGIYPESLRAVRKSLSDPGAKTNALKSKSNTVWDEYAYYYRRIGENHYHLRYLGSDRKPFTDDDIVPDMSAMPAMTKGLVIDFRQP